MNIAVKKNSSIWKLDTNWGNDTVSTNFCSLFWSVFWGFIMVSVGAILTGAFLGFLFAGIAASISVGYVIWTMPITILSGIVVVVSVIFAVAFTHMKASDTMEENPTGALSNTVNAYSAWKNKYCPQVIEK